MSVARRRSRTSTGPARFRSSRQECPASGRTAGGRHPSAGNGGVDHHTTVHEIGEGCVQAVCSCGWRSAVFGADKTTGTMDPLQQAVDAGDLHEWDASIS
jgi:hypothetical protein